MGQRECYEALAKIGGRGTLDEIRAEMAKVESQTVVNSARRYLQRLKGWGYISFNPKTQVWTTLEPFPDTRAVVRV